LAREPGRRTPSQCLSRVGPLLEHWPTPFLGISHERCSRVIRAPLPRRFYLRLTSKGLFHICASVLSLVDTIPPVAIIQASDYASKPIFIAGPVSVSDAQHRRPPLPSLMIPSQPETHSRGGFIAASPKRDGRYALVLFPQPCRVGAGLSPVPGPLSRRRTPRLRGLQAGIR